MPRIKHLSAFAVRTARGNNLYDENGQLMTVIWHKDKGFLLANASKRFREIIRVGEVKL